MVQLTWMNLVSSALLMTTISLNMDAESWRPVNDGVMGGVSSSRMEAAGEHLVFSGNLSLENNGGFASSRRLVTADLSGAEKVRLVLRGDGREYQFRIRQDRYLDGVAWRAMLKTTGDWQTLELDLAEFVPVFRGRTVRDAGPVTPERITQIGFMLADKNPGGFRLEIRSVEFVPAQTASQ
jgi:monofunctional biosynthetic peptidoglycan transglycosylase